MKLRYWLLLGFIGILFFFEDVRKNFIYWGTELVINFFDDILGVLPGWLWITLILGALVYAINKLGASK